MRKMYRYRKILKRIYIRAKDNEVYCDNERRNGRQQAAENNGYARVIYCRWDVFLSL